MNVLISGAGIAGLTLAFWLARRGHGVTVVEKSPDLRDEGYMIDFYGSGYDVAERMGLLPDLNEIHYSIPRLAYVDGRGREQFSVSYAAFRRLFGGRHFNFLRGDLVRVLYAKVQDEVELRFGTTVTSLQQEESGPHVQVSLSDGTGGTYDALVGADGVHSRVRQLAFGEERSFTRFLGYHTGAFILPEIPPELDGGRALYTMNLPGRQVAVYPARDDRLATFFVYQARQVVDAPSAAGACRELGIVYGDLEWIVPRLLEGCGQAGPYFDEVSQIEVPRWRAGRVVLVGDAAYCVSLVAGQGASMAMAGAYILAEELARSDDDVPAALARYEGRLRPDVEEVQRAGRRLAGWFVPGSSLQRAIGDLFTRMIEWPLAWRLVRRMLAPQSVILS